MEILPQEIFREKSSYNYTLNLERLGVTWFDIPKCGSSSIKRYLLSCNRGAPQNLFFGVGHANWQWLFPEAAVSDWASYNMQPRKLLILRNPVKRIKSGYKHIYTKMNNGDKSLSDFLSDDYKKMLTSNRSHVSNNHFKPQTWFFPNELIDDRQSLLWTTTRLNELPKALAQFSETCLIEAIPHQNSSDQNLGNIDMSDKEIRAMILPYCAADFDAYEKAKESENLFGV